MMKQTQINKADDGLNKSVGIITKSILFVGFFLFAQAAATEEEMEPSAAPQAFDYQCELSSHQVNLTLTGKSQGTVVLESGGGNRMQLSISAHSSLNLGIAIDDLPAQLSFTPADDAAATQTWSVMPDCSLAES